MPAGDLSFPYDFTLTINGGATYGFMLTSPTNQSKQIAFTEAGGPNPNRLATSDVVDINDFDPMVDVPFAMNDFSGGVGQLYYDNGQHNKYLWGAGVVTHVSGKAYPVGTPSTLILTGSGLVDVKGFTSYLTSANVRYDFLWTSGGKVWRRNSTTNGAWENVYTLSTDITDFTVIDGYGIACSPSATDGGGGFSYVIQSDVTRSAASWISGTGVTTAVANPPFSVSAGKPKFMRQVRGTTYAVVDNNKVYYTLNPNSATPTWSGPIDTTLTGNTTGAPGGTTYPFQGAEAVGDYLFLRKKDAVYSIDSKQNVTEVLWQWKNRVSEYNFKFAVPFKDYLVYSVGPEVYTYNPETGLNDSLELATQESFSINEIVSVTANNQYVFVLAKVYVPSVRSGLSYAIFRCIPSKQGKWTYEVLWEESNIASYGGWDFMYASPNGTGTTLYWTMHKTATDTWVWYITLDSVWDESTSSTTKVYGGSLWTSYSRSGFPGFTKRHVYFNINGKNTAASKYITVYRTISDDWLDSGTQNNVLTMDTTSYGTANYSNLNSKVIGLKFGFTVGTLTQTPCVLLNFDHHQRVRFKYLPAIKASVRVADNLALRNGAFSNKKNWEIWDDITTLRTTDTEILYKDFLGNSFNVTLDLVGVRPTRHEKPQAYEEEAVLTMTRIDRGA